MSTLFYQCGQYWKKERPKFLSLLQWTSLIVASLLNIQCSPLLKKANPLHPEGQPRKQNVQCPLFFEKALVCASLIPNVELRAGESLSFSLSFWSLDQDQSFQTPEMSQAFEAPETPHPLKDSSFSFDKLNLFPVVFLWMPMATGSHGSLPTRTVPATDLNQQQIPGAYQVNRVIFTMPGTWEIHVQLKNGDGSIYDEAVELIDVQ